MKFYYFSSLLLSILLICACDDHTPTDPINHLRVKNLTRILPDKNGITNISAFKYDNENRLISIISYQTPDSTAAAVGRTAFEYDGQNRLLIVRQSINPSVSETYRYGYNSNNQLAVIDYDAGNPEIYHITYKYNSNILESSLREFDFNATLRFKNAINYTFTGQNLSGITSVQTIEKVIPTVTTFSAAFIYDDKINPFYGVFLVPAPVLPSKPTSAQFNYYTYYGGYDNLLTLSPHNMVSNSRSTGEQITYSYIYNDAGYPTSRITLKKSNAQADSLTEETLLYEYETY
ncbi:hypothetical protein [Dyadobacter sp. NIV53]|uniref:hypothetical protein n=1 Tax=Dyadobacter sp. NIV53 TaxID=2861765 RepID=UPI001C872B70|nr:hypothetical protein [Dyadobacter sp. NIV53]